MFTLGVLLILFAYLNQLRVKNMQKIKKSGRAQILFHGAVYIPGMNFNTHTVVEHL